ncbi:hypothetical protein DPMN_037437 [Dreissena polymorpha]|uniref:Uncharacterized protein n=1 Tax=Dreissena polymorpha TaxID=45954 RepID=A0A9D4MDI8_DREPO|nr:hypothetical protein DPMN_037437 [Dreissena polymorpha]
MKKEEGRKDGRKKEGGRRIRISLYHVMPPYLPACLHAYSPGVLSFSSYREGLRPSAVLPFPPPSFLLRLTSFLPILACPSFRASPSRRMEGRKEGRPSDSIQACRHYSINLMHLLLA